MVAVVVSGIILRLVLVCLAPRYGYFSDHADFAQWGSMAAVHGVTSLYRTVPDPCTAVRYDSVGKRRVFLREKQVLCNYPPLAAFALLGLGKAHHALTDAPILNTPLTRLLYGIPTLIADLILAYGCLVVVTDLTGRASIWLFAAVFLCPPLLLDGALWGQVDSWLLAPAVWMLLAMQRRSWLWAGLLWGIALSLKTQGLLFVPVWSMALLTAPRRGPVLGAIVLAITWLNVVALPYWLTSGETWFWEAFVGNLTTKYPDTTLKAFNVWYLDLLWTGNRDSTRVLCGISRDAIGKLLLIAGLGLGCLLYCVRWRHVSGCLLWITCWTLLASVMLPTRVHDRYLILAIPFLLCAAFEQRRLGVGALAIVVVASFQVTWPNWATCLADSGTLETITSQYREVWDSLTPEQRYELPTLTQVSEDFTKGRAVDLPKELTLTALAIFGSAWVLAILAGTVANPIDNRCQSQE
jgi:hypothetical protein